MPRMRRYLCVPVLLCLVGCGGGSVAVPAPNGLGRLSSFPGYATSGRDVYAAAVAGNLSPSVAGDQPLVYVPNSTGNTVSIISQRSLKVIGQFRTGALPQH